MSLVSISRPGNASEIIVVQGTGFFVSNPAVVLVPAPVATGVFVVDPMAPLTVATVPVPSCAGVFTVT